MTPDQIRIGHAASGQLERARADMVWRACDCGATDRTETTKGQLAVGPRSPARQEEARVWTRPIVSSRRRSFRRERSGYLVADNGGAPAPLSVRYSRLSSSRQILRSLKLSPGGATATDNAWASMSQHELLAERDIVERAIASTYTFERRTDDVGRTRVRVSRNWWCWQSANS
jgi:hypothetical protein